MPTDRRTPAALDAVAPRLSADKPRLRAHRTLTFSGLALASALTLTACSGDTEDPGGDGGSAATEAAPSDGTAEPSDEDGSSTESGATDDGASADESDPAESSAHEDSSGGEYVPASAEGPAQNVPKPDMPADISEKTEDGVEAAVEYFWAADSYLVSTGDPSPFEPIVSESCAFCQEEIDYFTTIYSEGSWYVSTPDEVTRIAPTITGDKFAEAVISLDSTASAMYFEDGSKAGSDPTTYVMTWSIDLEYMDGQWVVTNTTAVEGSGSETKKEGS